MRLVLIGVAAWATFRFFAPYKMGWVIIPLGFAWSVFASMQMRHKAQKARQARQQRLRKELADL